MDSQTRRDRKLFALLAYSDREWICRELGLDGFPPERLGSLILQRLNYRQRAELERRVEERMGQPVGAGDAEG